MSTITKETIQRIAELARLGLDEAECASYADQCAKILEFVERLRNVDTSTVEPMAYASHRETAWREDTVQPSAQADAIVENAPDRDDRFFNVPKVIT